MKKNQKQYNKSLYGDLYKTSSHRVFPEIVALIVNNLKFKMKVHIKGHC